MSLPERLREVVSAKHAERVPSHTTIDTALYKAGIPQEYWERLREIMDGTPKKHLRALLGTAFLLQERLVNYSRLTERDRQDMLPELVRLAKLHGSEAVQNEGILDGLVEGYLLLAESTAIPQGVEYPRAVLRDRKTFPGQVRYGGKKAVVVYGERYVSGYSGGSGRQKDFKPSKNMVNKAEELVKVVSQGLNWRYAAELINDLGSMNGALFPNRSFYRGFLSDMGSVIHQRLPVEVELKMHPRSGMPIGYEIREAAAVGEGIKAAVQPHVNGDVPQQYVNRRQPLERIVGR